MTTLTISPADLLAGVAGILLSLAFTYLPSLRTRWAVLDNESKRLIMLGIILAIIVALYLSACAGPLWASLTGTTLACTQVGLIEAVKMFVAAVLTNQGAFLAAPQPTDVKQAKQGGDMARGLLP